MSWVAAYRAALRLLPAGLRRRQGTAMEALFAREYGRAHARGPLAGSFVGMAGICDVIRRAAYEQLRPACAHHALNDARDAEEISLINARAPYLAAANPGAEPMPQPTTGQLLRRHAASFSIALTIFTSAMLGLFASGRVPPLQARGAPVGDIVEMLVLAVPFTAAMTIPMAVLVAVLYEFTRLGANGTLAAATRERGGLRRLMMPVLGSAAGVGVLALVVTAVIVPRANERLASVLAGRAVQPNDRTMTIGELRAAARRVEPSAAFAAAEVAAYEVEIQKKLALPAGCVVLALVGIAIALRVPRGGTWLVIGASCVVIGVYYVTLTTGEDLADQRVVSPFVAMWGANMLLLAAALLAMWPRDPRLASNRSGTVAIL